MLVGQKQKDSALKVAGTMAKGQYAVWTRVHSEGIQPDPTSWSKWSILASLSSYLHSDSTYPIWNHSGSIGICSDEFNCLVHLELQQNVIGYLCMSYPKKESTIVSHSTGDFDRDSESSCKAGENAGVLMDCR